MRTSFLDAPAPNSAGSSGARSLSSITFLSRLSFFTMRIWVICGFLAGMLFAAGCNAESPTDTSPASETAFVPASPADSLALRLYEAHGGEAWEAAPYLRFDFAVEQGEQQRVVARHLWNRTAGTYRVEWTNSETDWVALLDLHSDDDPPVGQVFQDGEEVVGEAADEALQQAYQRYINDTYWLLAPLKVLDEGVQRTYDADASTAGREVLHLSFGDVGLTPGDQYWLHVDSETGRLVEWAFHLESMPEDAERRRFIWTGETAFDSAAGRIHLHTRKESTEGNMAITMPTLDLPEAVDESLFTDGTPNRLQ